MKLKREYTTKSGEKYPLGEAMYPMDFTIYRSDQRKAIIGSSDECILARGIKRNPDVLEVYIGSSGHAYVVFKGKRGIPAHAVHFKIRTVAARIRDAFDRDKAVKTHRLTLHAPTPGQTLEGLAKTNRDWRQQVKNGTRIPKKQETQRTTRITRLGVAHRPKAKIVKRNVSVGAQEMLF